MLNAESMVIPQDFRSTDSKVRTSLYSIMGSLQRWPRFKVMDSACRSSRETWKGWAIFSSWLVVAEHAQFCDIAPLSNNHGDGYKNVTKKWKSRCIKLYSACSASFNLSNVGSLFWSRILKDCIEVQERRKKVVAVCSRPPQKVKLGISSRSSSVVTVNKCAKNRDASAKLLFCQSKPIAFLPFSLTSPSSLLKLPNTTVK